MRETNGTSDAWKHLAGRASLGDLGSTCQVETRPHKSERNTDALPREFWHTRLDELPPPVSLSLGSFSAGITKKQLQVIFNIYTGSNRFDRIAKLSLLSPMEARSVRLTNVWGGDEAAA